MARTRKLIEVDEETVRRFLETYPAAVWLNPSPAEHWDYHRSTAMIRVLGPPRK